MCSLMAMTVKKDNNEVRIQWRVADIKIPTSEIKNISQDQEIHAVPDLDSKIFHVSVLPLVKLIECLLIQMIMNTLFIRTTTKRFITN